MTLALAAVVGILLLVVLGLGGRPLEAGGAADGSDAGRTTLLADSVPHQAVSRSTLPARSSGDLLAVVAVAALTHLTVVRLPRRTTNRLRSQGIRLGARGVRAPPVL